MTPLSEHQLLIFWVQLALLVAVARGLGGLMRRYGQPAVIGELAAGLIVGPSLLGRIAPDLYGWLFPADPVQSGLLLAVAWVGVAMLLVVTGFETDLKLVASLGRPAALVSTGSLVVPLGFGVLLGWILPRAFVGDNGDPLTLALFMGVALSISSLPVVAKILMDMGLMRLNIGQLIVAAAMANDIVGWLLLGMLAGVVASGGLDFIALGTTIAALSAFILIAMTFGQRATDAALRKARQGENSLLRMFTVVVFIALAAGAVTQAIGVEAVLGAFVGGILIGRSRYQSAEVTRTLEVVTNGFLAPVFFATAGLFVDLNLLFDLETMLWTLAVIAVAGLTKLIGTFAGGKFAGMPAQESLAVAVGLNARGMLEIVIATVGLGLGVLNQTSYTVVVVMAMTTSMMAPPLLRRALQRVEARPDEAARLAREAVLRSSVIARTETALLPTRGGNNSILAAKLLDLSLQPDASVTVYTVHAPGDHDAREKGEITAREVRSSFSRHATGRVEKSADDPAAAICSEADLGYGLLALGMTETFTGAHEISPTLRSVLARCRVPILLVKHGTDLDPHIAELPLTRIVVPAIGTRPGQAAQEIAYTLASRVDASVHAVHVVNRPDRSPDNVVMREPGSTTTVDGMLEEAQTLASRFGRSVQATTRTGVSVGHELAKAAEETGADLIVLGAQVRPYSGQPFLGHGVEWLLEHASQTVAVIVFPEHTTAG